MKKFVVLILVALIGGGAYMYFQEPEKFKEITEKVTSEVESLIAGNDWKDLKSYQRDFPKLGLEEIEAKEGYLADIDEKLNLIVYSDGQDGELILGNDEVDAKAMTITLPENSEGLMAEVAKDQWKHFFTEEVEFLESGEKEAEHATGSWKNEKGVISILIHRRDLPKIPPVKELAEEVQSAISEYRQIVQKKVDMENRFTKLDDEKHFCFDAARFKEIVNEMDDLKKQAEELTKKAKEVMAKIPEAQVVMIRKELDGASLE